MTIYYLACVFAGFTIGMIAMYFLRQGLIGKLAFDVYFIAKSYIAVSETLLEKSKNTDDQTKAKINIFLSEVEVTAYRAKKHIPEKWNASVQLIDQMSSGEINAPYPFDREV